MIVKLNKEMIRLGLGFHDMEAKQRIFQSQKAYDEGVAEPIEVSDTSFVRDKLSTGELILIKESSKKEKSKKESGSATLLQKAKDKITGKAEASTQTKDVTGEVSPETS